MSDKISTPSRKRRIVLCMGPYCNSGGGAERLCDKLTELLGERGPAWMAKGPVRWEIATCLSMCGAGPNLLVYPEGTAYHNLEPKLLEQIVRQCLEDVSGGEKS
jgi:(2Fe-2S) ferredoxin